MVVRTDAGRVTARYLLLACNGYLENLSRRAAGKIMPINNFVLATELRQAVRQYVLCTGLFRPRRAHCDTRGQIAG